MIRLFAWVTCALVLLGAEHPLAIAQFASRAYSLLPGSRFAVRFASAGAPSSTASVGGGRFDDGFFVIPVNAHPGDAMLVAAGSSGIAVRGIHIVAPPRGRALAVASYEDGIVFHDPRTFAMLGTLATGGAPSDITALGEHGVATTDTDGTNVTTAGLSPWSVRAVAGVPLGDELIADAPMHALFVTERELDGKGGLARIIGDHVTSTVTGSTAEGVAIDIRRQLVYVADANDDDIAIVDARTLRMVGRIRRIPRAFALALSADGSRLYAVSNQGIATLFGAAGLVSEIALSASRPRVLVRSEPLAFPVGIALDEERHELYVTDEQADAIDVLNEDTLRAARPALQTCSIPWKPLLDSHGARLYVPCAGSNEVDVFDTRTLRRIRGAPFHTGGYPLAVASVQ